MSDARELVERLRTSTMRRRDFFKLTGSLGAAAALASLNTTTAQVTESAEELVVAFTPDPLQMSPWLPNSMPGYSIAAHIYEPTIFRDEQMNLVPYLAESFEQISPDTIQIRLRQGVRFHNGEELTSAAVKFSYETIISEGSKALWKAMLASIRVVETPDPYTALVHTTEPNRALIRNLTLVGIMTEQIYNEIGENWANMAIGTGPFRFVEYQPGNQVVLERNEEYWGDKPALRRIVFRIITENGTRISSLQSGDVAMINNVPPDQIDGIESRDELQILSTPTARIVYCGLRTDRPPFDNVQVRQALNYAINKEEIVNGLFAGRTEAAVGPLAPMVFGAATDLGPWPYDPDRARQLLKEAGNPNPTVVFGCANGRYINDRLVGETIAGYMGEVGFNVEFLAPEWGDYYAEVFRNEESQYDMHLLAWGVINLEPDYQLREHFHSQWSRRTGYSNPEVDRLLDEAARTFEEAQTIELLRQAQEIIWEESPWAWLYFQPEIHGVSSRLMGYSPRPDEYIRFHRATLTGG